jgi:S-adenosylmethionine/arginine decarboxylase-like enzyme
MTRVHKHIIIRADVLDSPTNEVDTSNKVRELIESIDMKILMGPYAKYCTIVGNRGLTVATIIETSHIVMHTWDESVPANVQLDVYTCAEFDTKIVFEWLEQFNPTKIDYKYLDREHGLKEIQINE